MPVGAPTAETQLPAINANAAILVNNLVMLCLLFIFMAPGLRAVSRVFF
jgi:hypothetical protein